MAVRDGLLLTSTGHSYLNNDPLSFVLKNKACDSPETILCMDGEIPFSPLLDRKRT